METVTVDKKKLRKLLELLDSPNACSCVFCPHQASPCACSNKCSDMAYGSLVVPKQLRFSFDSLTSDDYGSKDKPEPHCSAQMMAEADCDSHTEHCSDACMGDWVVGEH